jgi:hypothetical protein
VTEPPLGDALRRLATLADLVPPQSRLQVLTAIDRLAAMVGAVVGDTTPPGAGK